jgi:hypothetical protein
MSQRTRLQRLMHSRLLLAAGIALALVLPAVTLPRLPQVNLWPAVVGLLPWMVGKYVLCPLRWRVLTSQAQSRRWHLRAYAESELLGMLTPGHVGADLWRVRRLNQVGLAGGDAVASVALDRFVGAIGLTAFVAFAGSQLPLRMLVVAAGAAAAVLVLVLVLRRVRPALLPTGPLPSRGQLVQGLVLAAAYQLTIAAFLLGTIEATGHIVTPMQVLGAFGASQLAGVVPGPTGASPRDGALVVALVALGLPWQAAAAAVTLKTALAWLPALALGGISLFLTRRHFGGLSAHHLAPAPAPA